jgi:hypothetical protein
LNEDWLRFGAALGIGQAVTAIALAYAAIAAF